MKYVIMIHSHPQPWGHPTGDFLPEYRDLDPAVKARMDADFERLLTELDERGELVGGEALGDPVTSRLYRWHDDAPLAVDGPYSETKEHLAGFFLIVTLDALKVTGAIRGLHRRKICVSLAAEQASLATATP